MTRLLGTAMIKHEDMGADRLVHGKGSAARVHSCDPLSVAHTVVPASNPGLAHRGVAVYAPNIVPSTSNGLNEALGEANPASHTSAETAPCKRLPGRKASSGQPRPNRQQAHPIKMGTAPHLCHRHGTGSGAAPPLGHPLPARATALAAIAASAVAAGAAARARGVTFVEFTGAKLGQCRRWVRLFRTHGGAHMFCLGDLFEAAGNKPAYTRAKVKALRKTLYHGRDLVFSKCVISRLYAGVGKPMDIAAADVSIEILMYDASCCKKHLRVQTEAVIQGLRALDTEVSQQPPSVQRFAAIQIWTKMN